MSTRIWALVAACLSVIALVCWSSAEAAAAITKGPVQFSDGAPVTAVLGSTVPTAATPYPSSIMVSGLSGVVSDVSVDLKDITAADFGGLDVLLVSPEGLNLTLVSDVGRGWSAEHLNLTLSDSASQPVAVSADPVSGNYLATNEGLTPDGYPPPAPPIREATSFAAAFANTKPNGSWSLYVVADGDTIRNGPAVIQGGWNLRITTVTGPDVTTTSVRSLKNPSIAGVSVGYAVTVADLDGRAVTEGTVILTVDGNQVGFAGGLNGADVTFIVPPLDEGSHRVKATYQPGRAFGRAAGP